jgi:hypothetical protein
VTRETLGGNAASLRATALALAKVESAAVLVLVEGISDQTALETAAACRGRDLSAERVVIVPIGGAHAIDRFLTRLAPGVRVAGLCDLLEEDLFRRGFAARPDLSLLGSFVCVNDLEEELIRAVGTAEVEALFAAQGDLRSFRTFRKQLAWRNREPEAQTYRFIRSSSQRNLRYARLLVEAAARRDALPRPLDMLLNAV